MTKILDKIVIKDEDIKVRKRYAPATKVHNPKYDYKRKSKYNDTELWDEIYGEDLV